MAKESSENFNGHLLVIGIDGSRTTTAITGRTPELEELRAGVGGHIEVVPFLDRIVIDGKSYECIAFCNEEGKIDELPFNPFAHKLWQAAVGRTITEDYLVGPIVIAYGSAEWLAEF